MAAYNSVDGVPCSNNEVLLDGIVRQEWGFKGLIVSDYSGINGVYKAHHVVDSLPAAEAACLKAGLDVMLPNGYRDLLALVKSGKVSESDIDRSVRRVLAAKFQLGLFSQPYVDTAMANRIVRSPAHRALALKAAIETMTLLKNDRQTLPLADHVVKRLGVFGPAANVLSLGDYSGPAGGWKGDSAVTPYQGLVRRLQGKSEVILYQRGMDAVALAKSCDAIVYFATIQEGEAHDRSLLTLPEVDTMRRSGTQHGQVVDDASGPTIREDQERMIRTIAATGVKTIVVLENGSPIDMHRWIDTVGAVLEAWYPGEQGGTAIASVLFGDTDPGGRLPVTWPKHAGQLPVYYAIEPSGRGYDYMDDDGKPMFPFGYGLSYTSFRFPDLSIPSKLQKGDSLKVKVTVSNTGDRTGDAVIQLYLHDSSAPVVRPIRELKAFKRVTLASGESREVTLAVPYRSFGYWDRQLKFVIPRSIYRVYISQDAATDLLQGTVEVE
jgi:beta-glucosidase